MYNILINGQTKDNENHRDQLIRDMIYVCCLPGLSAKSRKEFLDKAVSWPFSDKGNENIYKSAKYKGCEFWSKKAWEQYENTGSTSGLRHEHVVPRHIFKEAMEIYFKEKRDLIKEEKIIDFNVIFKELKPIMNKNLFGCVVTKDEAILIDGGKGKNATYKKYMPDEAYGSKPHTKKYDKFFNIENAWARYTRLNDKITIYRLVWKENNRGWADNPNVIDYNYLSISK